MRPIRIALLCALLALPLIVTAGASALDIEIDDQPPDAEVGTPYTFQFTAEEGCKPYVFSYSGGEVPPGLTITTDGRLTGTPTEAGFYKFYAAVDDHNDGKICFGSMQSQGTFEMVVLRHLSITTDQLPTARPGQYYSTTLAASDGEVFQWEVSEGALPPGMKMAGDFSKTATISGTPATAGSYTFTATVMDLSRVRVDSKQFTLNVATPLAPSAPSLGPSEVGVAYRGSVSSTGGVQPVAWTVASGSLPAGLALATSGAITGTPRVAGRFAVTFAATGADGERATVPGTIQVAQKLAITTTTLETATAGSAFTQRLTARGGTRPLTWRVASGALPKGMKLDRSTGVLSGTPSKTGTSRFTVEAKDRLGGKSTRTYRIQVVH